MIQATSKSKVSSGFGTGNCYPDHLFLITR